MAISGQYAYLVGPRTLLDRGMGLTVLDISNPTNCVVVGRYETIEDGEVVKIQDNYAYVADRKTGMHIFNVANPRACTHVGSYRALTRPWGMDVRGRYVYIGTENAGLQILEISKEHE